MKLIRFFLFLLLPCFAYSQAVNTLLQEVTLPAPNSAALGKYADYPVGHFTGVPSVSIPLYTLEQGPLELPISLSYHASGVRVSELASWVGLGWSLDAGGVITRTVQGLPDDISSGYLNKGKEILDAAALYPMPAFQNVQGIMDLPSPYREGAFQRQEVAKGLLDAEPDIFTFHIAGYSGKFVFDKHGHIHFLPESDVRITYSRRVGNASNNGYIHRFILTIPDGTRYIFGTLEEENSSSSSGIEFSSYTGLQNQAVVPTTWYLRKMESVDRRHSITFSYQDERYTYLSPGSCSQIFTTDGGSGTSPSCGPIPYGVQNSGVSETLMEGKRLSTITHSAGVFAIHFIARKEREDIDNQLGPKAKRLDVMEVVAANDPCNRKFTFQYDYFMALESERPEKRSKSEYKRLRLNSLQESSCDASIPPYTFSYHEGQLPHRMSKAIDHWGFFNGATGNEGRLNIPPLRILNHYGSPISPMLGGVDRESDEEAMKIGTLNRLTYPMGGSTSFVYEANRVQHYQKETTNLPIFSISNCNEPSASCCENDAFTREASFTFSEEELENATFSISLLNLTNLPSLVNNPFAYCRVSQDVPIEAWIKVKDPNGQAIASTSLNIGSQEKSGSKPLLGEPFIPLKEIETSGHFQAGVSYTFHIYASWAKASFNIFSSLEEPVSNERIVGGLRIKKMIKHDGFSHENDIIRKFIYTTHQNSKNSSGRLYSEPSYYGYYYDVFGNPIATMIQSSPVTPLGNFHGNHIGYSRVAERMEGNGYTEHLFTIEPNIASLTNTYPYPPQEFLARDGKLFAQRIFKENSPEPIQEIRYEAEPDSYTYISGNMYKTYQLNLTLPAGTSQTYYAFKPYKIRTSPYRIRKETHTLDEVTVSTSYSYDPHKRHLFPIKTSTANSDGRITEERRKYPQDYLSTLSFGQESLVGIQDLINQHLIGAPIETQTWTGKDGKLKMIRGQLQLYKNFGGSGFPILKPAATFQFEHHIPQASVNDGYNSTTSLYEKLLPKDVSAYYQESATYLYESTFGMLVEQALSKGTPTAIIWNENGTRPLIQIVGKPYQEVKGIRLSQLRSLKGTLVTTYTYDQKLRLISTTSPDGIKLSFSYDGLDRLVSTKDLEGNLLQHIRYNYSSL